MTAVGAALKAASLAVEGGTPIRTSAFAAWPKFDAVHIQAASRVLESGRVNYWTGNECRMFEAEYAQSIGVKHAVALTNGTVALELALIALGLQPGDEVVVTPRSFIASASCVALCGGVPVFADVDESSQNIHASSIEAVITPKTRGIIAVHLAGWPCEMDEIRQLARDKKLFVIEDCAQAHGARYRDVPVGAMSDVAAFSFCQDKIITTGGEGGLLATSDEMIWNKAWSYKDHGKSYDAVYGREHAPGFRWLHESFGTNWRMLEMQGAIGRVMLADLKRSVALRRRNAALLTSRLKSVPGIRVTEPPPHIFHSYYKYYFFVEADQLQPEWSRDRVMQAVVAEGIPCFSGSCSEIYLEKAFSGSPRLKRRLEKAQKLGETSLMLLVHPTLSEKDMHDMADAVEKVMKIALR